MTSNEESVRNNLAELGRSGPRKLAAFALWILDHLDEVAFLSIRGLAEAAGVDANLAPRLAQTLGYEGFNDFRADIRNIVQNRGKSYGKRARALRSRQSSGIYGEVIDANQRNFDNITAPLNIADIDDCVELLLGAKKIYSIGVRSCFSVAHYFSYVGSMAFDSFVDVPSMPGAILDQVSRAGPDDVVIAITYEHYSAEVVRACQIAREKDAQIIALTDSNEAPITKDAVKTIVMPMAGPQLMPSLVSAFLTVEMILAAMAARSEPAAERIEAFEQRIAGFGGYMRYD